MQTLKDIRDKIRDYMLQHERSPMNEQQMRAVLQSLLVDLQDLEADESAAAREAAERHFTR